MARGLLDDARCVRCHHERDRHIHNRPGSDCGGCDCQRFRPGLQVAYLLAKRLFGR